MKIARTYILTVLVICLMCISGCFEHTAPDSSAVTGTNPPAATSKPGESTSVTSAATATATEATVPASIPTEPPTEPPATSAPPTEPSTVWPDLDDAEFVRIVDYVPNVRQSLRYATADNFTGQIIYEFTDAYLRYGTVKKLAQVAQELEELGLGLVIWDGYRPLYAQQKLWDVCPDPNYVSRPGTGRQTHCRGIAVDITLYDLETGELLEMPSDFDEFSALGDRDYSDCSVVARESALILEKSMENAGFLPYSGEWWHFSDTQDYPIEEIFDPAQPQIWIANCNQYINLRRTPGGESFAQIPKGEQVQLLQWNEKYARVVYRGMTGWVNAAYIMPAGAWLEGQLEAIEITALYSYEEMLRDLEELAAQYPALVNLDTVGYSDQGTPIPALRIGSVEADHHVLLQGAIHGREHATAWLLMAMAESWLNNGGFENLCIHILPMVNPDGVAISQSGQLNDDTRWVYLTDIKWGHTLLEEAEYAARWKANGFGVDINRNFPTGWEDLDNRKEPSSQQYRGSEPFSSSEAKTLRDYSLQFAFDLTVSYHASGSLTYYDFGNNSVVNQRGLQLAKEFQRVSGYEPTHCDDLDAGGYKDWAIAELEIPSLTIEVGCGEAPLHQRELYNVFARNVRLGEILADYLKN